MKNVSPINDAKDVVVKETTDALDTRLTVVENKANSIFSSVNETFETNERIDSSLTTATWENGYVRALYANKYQEFFDNLNMLEQPLSSFTVQDGLIKRSGGGSNPVSFTTKSLPNFTGGVTELQVNFPDSPTLTTRSGFKPNVQETVTHSLASKYVDVEGNEWTIRHDNALTATGGTYLSAKSSSGNPLFNEIRLNPTTGNNTVNLGATTRNLCIVGDDTNIYVAYYTSTNDIALRAIRRSDRVLGTAVGINSTSTNGYRGQDLLIHNNRLFHIRTVAGGGTTEFPFRNYIVTSQTLGPPNTVTGYSDTTVSTGHYCRLALDPSGEGTVLAVGFRRATSNAVHYVRANATTGALIGSWTTVAQNCYGNGAVKFHNGLFRIVYERNDQTSFGYFTLSPSTGTAGSVSTSTVWDGNVTISPYRFDIVCFDNKLLIFYSEFNFYDSVFVSYFTLGATFSLTDTVIYGTSSALRGIDVYAVTNNSYKVMAEDHTNSTITVIEYGSVTETLTVSVRNSANALQLATATYTGSNQLTFNISQTDNFRLRFTTQFSLQSITGLSDNTSNFELKGFDVEATQVAIQPPTSVDSWFYSDVLIDNQYVDSAMLTPSVSNASNGSFEWSVSASGSNWQTITNFGQFVNLNTSGVFLKVRCKITRNSGITTISSLPRIDGFELTTKSVVTTSDLLPLQINLMKMGLQVATWNALQRTGFNKMMIDTFNDTNGVASSTISGGGYNSTNKWYSGTGIVTSVVENTDTNIFPAQILVVDDINSIGTIVYRVKRNNGNWEQVIPNQIYTFTSGTSATTNQIQIQADLQNYETLAGWAYLYA